MEKSGTMSSIKSVLLSRKSIIFIWNYSIVAHINLAKRRYQTLGEGIRYPAICSKLHSYFTFFIFLCKIRLHKLRFLHFCARYAFTYIQQFCFCASACCPLLWLKYNVDRMSCPHTCLYNHPFTSLFSH